MFKLGVGAEAKAAKATAAADALQALNKAEAKAAKEPAGPKPIEVVPTSDVGSAVAEEEFPPESEFETSLKAVGE